MGDLLSSVLGWLLLDLVGAPVSRAARRRRARTGVLTLAVRTAEPDTWGRDWYRGRFRVEDGRLVGVAGDLNGRTFDIGAVTGRSTSPDDRSRRRTTERAWIPHVSAADTTSILVRATELAEVRASTADVESLRRRLSG